MKRIERLGLTVLTAAAICLAAAGVWAAEVSQGKCIQYDEAKKLITIEEYDIQIDAANPHGKPTGVQLVFDVGDAEIGAKPQPGDILRFAWIAAKNEKSALKVMNVTRTNLMKK